MLELLLHKGPQPVKVIGKRVLVTSGSISAAINRLESRKLVRRTRDREDQRARIVQLTGRGRRLTAAAFRRHALEMEQTVAVLKPLNAPNSSVCSKRPACLQPQDSTVRIETSSDNL